MEQEILEVLLPFHLVDSNLFAAIDSCLDAMPPNSRLITINTLSAEKITESYSEKITEIEAIGRDYIEALEIGLAHSTAKYIALMNSDDLVSSKRFILQIEGMEKGKFNLCSTNIKKFVTRDGNRLLIPPLLGTPPAAFSRALLLIGSFRADATWCFNRNWATENQLFENKIDISDWCTGIRVMVPEETLILEEDLYFYRMHDNQITRSANRIMPPLFYEQWNQLNLDYNFNFLKNEEIRHLALPWEKSKRISNLRPILNWLTSIENHLKRELPVSDRGAISNIIARRRFLLSMKNRKIGFRIQDFRYLPKILLEYFKYRKYLRISLY